MTKAEKKQIILSAVDRMRCAYNMDDVATAYENNRQYISGLHRECTIDGSQKSSLIIINRTLAVILADLEVQS